jgi:hypothetical protein
MTRRIARSLFLAIPAVVLLSVTGLVFLAARAPRTWAANWSAPHTLRSDGSQDEYGAVHTSAGWDLLWYDDADSRLKFGRTGAGRRSTEIVDRGEIVTPTMVSYGRQEIGAWVLNGNVQTELDVADLSTSGAPHVVRLLEGDQPIEHPYLFAGPDHRLDLIFSWQLHGNFDTYLVPLSRTLHMVHPPVRLTHARFYRFYPRAVTDPSGGIDVLSLDECCDENAWKVMLDRYSARGAPLQPARELFEVGGLGTFVPEQWGEDLRLDGRGHVWGAFVGEGGGWVFELNRSGGFVLRPRLVETDSSLSGTLSLAVTPSDGYAFWESTAEVTTYIASQKFSLQGRPIGAPERVVYEAGPDANPHAASSGGQVSLVWEHGGSQYYLESASYHAAQPANVAERLGLALGNPWEEAAILVVGSFGIATLTTAVNILVILVLAAASILMLRLLRRVPLRWPIYGVVLVLGLYALFVTPGWAPVLFLSTLPAMGFSAVPFGLLAAGATLVTVEWMGTYALRRFEDPYRAALMTVLGVYCCAFLEALVFVQQRLGVI